MPIEFDHENVTTRELAHNTGRVLDRVCLEGKTLTVLRHNRPIARIVPLDGVRARLRRQQEITDREPDEPEIPDLSDLEKELLRAVANGTYHECQSRLCQTMHVSKIMVAMTKLELKGLQRKTRMGFDLTDKGLQVVEDLET
jgi:antitoxin (DNA-binding transcriptional repressor) of toxin-antitoxin stability system